jgi:pilus assembly protein CpaE
MDAQHAIVKTISEIAHIITGRSEIKARAKPGITGILEKLRPKKK